MQIEDADLNDRARSQSDSVDGQRSRQFARYRRHGRHTSQALFDTHRQLRHFSEVFPIYRTTDDFNRSNQRCATKAEMTVYEIKL